MFTDIKTRGVFSRKNIFVKFCLPVSMLICYLHYAGAFVVTTTDQSNTTEQNAIFRLLLIISLKRILVSLYVQVVDINKCMVRCSFSTIYPAELHLQTPSYNTVSWIKTPLPPAPTCSLSSLSYALHNKSQIRLNYSKAYYGS